MIWVLSGEGPTDIGQCTNALGESNDDSFIPGPMTVIIDQISEPRLGYSMRDYPDCLYFINESALSARTRALPIRLQPARSKKKGSETGYFFSNTMALGYKALDLENKTNDKAIAVLFRDHDGSRSDSAKDWDTKWKSMRDGFERSRFSRGVPMLPKPKSEAWLICAAQSDLNDCSQLELISGNDASEKSAKKKLDAVLGGHQSAAELCDWLDAHPFNIDRALTMPSFKAFKNALECALNEVL